MEQKPIILEIEEAKQELVQCVNNIMATHRLPCYLIEPVFKDLYEQVKSGAQNEIMQAREAAAVKSIEAQELVE